MKKLIRTSKPSRLGGFNHGRIKGVINAHKRKIMKLAKGYYGSKSKAVPRRAGAGYAAPCVTLSAVSCASVIPFLWIARINAATHQRHVLFPSSSAV